MSQTFAPNKDENDLSHHSVMHISELPFVGMDFAEDGDVILTFVHRHRVVPQEWGQGHVEVEDKLSIRISEAAAQQIAEMLTTPSECTESPESDD